MLRPRYILPAALFMSLQGLPSFADQKDLSCQQQLNTGNYSAVINSTKEALTASPKNGALHYCLGEAYRRTGELTQSLTELKYAEQYTLDKESLMNIHNRLGMILSKRDDDDAALKHYTAYRTLAKELGKKDDESSALNNMAVIYYSRGQYNLALIYFEDALKLSPDDSKNAATYGNIATVYLGQNDNDKAIEYQRRAIDIDRKNHDNHSLSVDLLNLGSIYRVARSYDNAKQFLFDGLEGIRKIKDAYWEGMAYRYISWLYSDRGEVPEARKWMEGAADIFTRIGAESDAEKTRRDLQALAQPAAKADEATRGGAN